jgi:hypothetical protein
LLGLTRHRNEIGSGEGRQTALSVKKNVGGLYDVKSAILPLTVVVHTNEHPVSVKYLEIKTHMLKRLRLKIVSIKWQGKNACSKIKPSTRWT